MVDAVVAMKGEGAGRQVVRLAQILWGSPLLRLRFSLTAALFLWWLWRNRCCETDEGQFFRGKRVLALSARRRSR